jgi:hypothetical protein
MHKDRSQQSAALASDCQSMTGINRKLLIDSSVDGMEDAQAFFPLRTALKSKSTPAVRAALQNPDRNQKKR